MVASSIALSSHTRGWLRGLPFDSIYIFGTLGLALISASFVVSNPKLFLPVFILNGWLLGYHHVVSTYTRLTFDSDSFKQHRFLIVWLPLLVIAGVAILCALLGVWVLVSGYLYWQWWHYTRQSYGVSRIFARKAGVFVNDRLTTALIYAVPVWGILYRSYQAPREYLFAEVKVVPVPFFLVAAAGVFAIVVVGLWLWRQINLYAKGQLPVAHTAYLVSHLTAFTFGYLLIQDINHGWLVLNIWHNSQYILTVWMFNNSRFKDPVNARHKFLAHISQRQNITLYFGVCLLISTIFYGAINYSLSWAMSSIAAAATLPLFAVVYQGINFHHYIVDALIWKVRKKSVRQNLGIES
jgi:hypothetical protein